jgi:hypothetical protein
MRKENALAVFENFKIRRVYDEKAEIWYFSVVVNSGDRILNPNQKIHRINR